MRRRRDVLPPSWARDADGLPVRVHRRGRLHSRLRRLAVPRRPAEARLHRPLRRRDHVLQAGGRIGRNLEHVVRVSLPRRHRSSAEAVRYLSRQSLPRGARAERSEDCRSSTED